MKPDKFLVFDVESIGLHGEGFAVGYVVVNSKGIELDAGRLSCPPSAARGTPEGREWVDNNIPKFPTTHEKPFQVRTSFFAVWEFWKGRDCVLIADCGWPVEARFLIQSIEDHFKDREWFGPYPLHDLATLSLAHGRDPLATTPRLPSELPIHDPLADARQSARVLIELINSPCTSSSIDSTENSPTP